MSNATLRFWCGLLYYLWNPLIRMMVLEHQTSNFNLINPFNKLPPLSATITFMGSSLPGNTWKWMVNASNQMSIFIWKSYRKQTEGCPGLRRDTGLCIAETYEAVPLLFSSVWSSSYIMPWALIPSLVEWRPWANRWSLGSPTLWGWSRYFPLPRGSCSSPLVPAIYEDCQESEHKSFWWTIEAVNSSLTEKVNHRRYCSVLWWKY